MTERDPALEPFDALIGTWATEATRPLFDAVVPGNITFELFEGGHFLVQRSHNDHELFPDAISVIGVPEAGARSPSASPPRWGMTPSRADGRSPARRATGRTT